jgi:hypothetical protein
MIINKTACVTTYIRVGELGLAWQPWGSWRAWYPWQTIPSWFPWDNKNQELKIFKALLRNQQQKHD